MKIKKILVIILSLTILLSTNKLSFSEVVDKNWENIKKYEAVNQPNPEANTLDLIVDKKEFGIFNKLDKIVPFIKKAYCEPATKAKEEILIFNEDNKHTLMELAFSGVTLTTFTVLLLMASYLSSLLFVRGVTLHMILGDYPNFKIENNSSIGGKVLHGLIASFFAISGFKSKYDLLMKKKEEKLCKLQSLTEKLAQATARKNNCLDSVRVFLDELKLITKVSNTHLLEKIISDSDCIAYKHEGPEEGGCCSIYFKKSKTKDIKLTEEDKDTLRQNFNKLAKDLENLLNEEM